MAITHQCDRCKSKFELHGIDPRNATTKIWVYTADACYECARIWNDMDIKVIREADDFIFAKRTENLKRWLKQEAS